MVIGVGNADRGDDAAGLIAVRRVRQCAPGVRTIERSGDIVGLLEKWEGEERVILIDATCSGAAPGTVHRLNAHEAPVPFLGFRGSTHSWGVGEAVELGAGSGSIARPVGGLWNRSAHPSPRATNCRRRSHRLSRRSSGG